MNLDRYTQKAQEAVLAAKALAEDSRHASIEPAHLCLARVRQPDGIVPAIVTRIAGTTDLLSKALEQELEGRPQVQGGASQLGLSRPAAEALDDAESRARAMKDDYVSTAHLLLALAAGPLAKLLGGFGLHAETVLEALSSVRGSQRVVSPHPEDTYQALERYGRDLTRLARQGKLDPVIGRDEEIRRLIQVPSRRPKNNPALIGR